MACENRPRLGLTPSTLADRVKALRAVREEAIGLNLFLGAFNYLNGSEYAKISFETIKENFKHGFDWDADKFITNQFAHPYHGNLYYNFARSLGYGFWEGLGNAAIGSFQ